MFVQIITIKNLLGGKIFMILSINFCCLGVNTKHHKVQGVKSGIVLLRGVCFLAQLQGPFYNFGKRKRKTGVFGAGNRCQSSFYIFRWAVSDSGSHFSPRFIVPHTPPQRVLTLSSLTNHVFFSTRGRTPLCRAVSEN